jgi:hypothetical protein
MNENTNNDESTLDLNNKELNPNNIKEWSMKYAMNQKITQLMTENKIIKSYSATKYHEEKIWKLYFNSLTIHLRNKEHNTIFLQSQ